MEPVAKELAGWDPDTALAGKYLYGNMPLSDIANYSADIFYEFAAHGVFLYREYEKSSEASGGDFPELCFVS